MVGSKNFPSNHHHPPKNKPPPRAAPEAPSSAVDPHSAESSSDGARPRSSSSFPATASLQKPTVALAPEAFRPPTTAEPNPPAARSSSAAPARFDLGGP